MQISDSPESTTTIGATTRSPAETGLATDLSRPVILRDGTSAWMRPAGPEDKEARRSLFDRASPESRALRFFAAKREVSPAYIDDLIFAKVDELTLVVSQNAGAGTEDARAVSRVEDQERLAAVASLRPLMQPRSVAVIGASRDPLAAARAVAVLSAGFAEIGTAGHHRVKQNDLPRTPPRDGHAAYRTRRPVTDRDGNPGAQPAGNNADLYPSQRRCCREAMVKPDRALRPG